MSEPRAITAVVSKYQRARVWRGKFVRNEVFSLGINLTGCLAEGATIDTITWRIQNPNSVILGNATVGDTTASVECTCGIGSGSVVKVIATDTDGKVWAQLYLITVAGQPFFQNDPIPAMGSYTVTA
jgi:hypothetical protein